MLKNEGFSLIELIVVMFILSILTFFTLPVLRAPGNMQEKNRQKSHNLARFMDGLRQKAVRERSDYALHIDMVSGKAWVDRLVKTAETGTEEEDTGIGDSNSDDDATQEISISGFQISGVEIAGPESDTLEDIIIRFPHTGITDMALIRMEEDDEIVTLRLHPFIEIVEIIHGAYSFNDCP